MAEEKKQESKGMILLVEDDKMLSEMYSLKFTQGGYEVLTALDGAAAHTQAKKKPDLILLDIILPRMDGFAVLEKLKDDPVTKDIPVVMLTNLGQEGDVQRGLDLGAVDYMVKTDHTPSQVLEKVEQVLKK